MNHGKIAALFAGQGVFHDIVPESSPSRDRIRGTFQEIDRVANGRFGISFSRNILGSAPDRNWHADAPELIQLAVFGYSVAAYAYREDCGWRPSVMVGHGFGEIPALVCGGAFSVSEGAEIVCERAAVLERLAKGAGSMIALEAPSYIAEDLMKAAGTGQAAVAADNSETHSVISGSHAALDRVLRMARSHNIGVKRLAAPYPLHCPPLMSAAAAELARRLNSLTGNALRIPVFSPILGQYYGEIGSPGSFIAEHLVKPIRFLSAVRTLRAHGIDEFVECGALNGLARSIGRASAGAAAKGALAA